MNWNVSEYVTYCTILPGINCLQRSSADVGGGGLPRMQVYENKGYWTRAFLGLHAKSWKLWKTWNIFGVCHRRRLSCGCRWRRLTPITKFNGHCFASIRDRTNNYNVMLWVHNCGNDANVGTAASLESQYPSTLMSEFGARPLRRKLNLSVRFVFNWS